MYHTKPLSRNQQYLLILLTPLYFIIIGLLVQPFPEIIDGIITIIKEPDFLITDYVALGGVGATLINASLVMIFGLAMMYFSGNMIIGTSFAGLGLLLGFAMFGKNVANVWPIFLGTYVYSKFRGEPFSKNIYFSFYGTSLAPIVTATAQIEAFSLPVRLICALLIGMLIGFAMPPLCERAASAHKGYSLYNGGFTAGIIATIIMSVYKCFGFEFGSRRIWATGYNDLFVKIMVPYCLALIIGALIIDRKAFSRFVKLLSHPGVAGSDFIVFEGWGATLFNMGAVGLFSTFYLCFVGADLNGASVGGIITVIGFGAAGKHLRNIIPIMLGITLASGSPTWSITDPGPVLALMFGTTLAPMAGEFGFFAGVLTGFIHAGVVQNVGAIYGGMNLYNNGFSGGLVATFLTPIFFAFRLRKAQKAEEQKALKKRQEELTNDM